MAGGPFEGGIFKCGLQSVDAAIAAGVYGSWVPSAAERDRLMQIFPEGVCDWSQRDDPAADALAGCARKGTGGSVLGPGCVRSLTRDLDTGQPAFPLSDRNHAGPLDPEGPEEPPRRRLARPASQIG